MLAFITKMYISSRNGVQIYIGVQLCPIPARHCGTLYTIPARQCRKVHNCTPLRAILKKAWFWKVHKVTKRYTKFICLSTFAPHLLTSWRWLLKWGCGFSLSIKKILYDRRHGLSPAADPGRHVRRPCPSGRQQDAQLLGHRGGPLRQEVHQPRHWPAAGQVQRPRQASQADQGRGDIEQVRVQVDS